MKKWGYARGLIHESREEISSQVSLLVEAGVDELILEYRYVSPRQKPPIQTLLEKVEQGDTIMVLGISRVCRNTKQFYDLLGMIRKKNLRLITLEGLIIDCRFEELDLETNACLCMAGELERMEAESAKEFAQYRTEHKLKKGDTVGRPATTIEDIPASFIRCYPMFVNKEMNISQVARQCRLSRPTVYKYIRLLKAYAEQAGKEE